MTMTHRLANALSGATMISEWIRKLAKGAMFRRWETERDDRVDYNRARQFVEAWERGDREAAERAAAGMRVPFRKRNQDKLRIAIDIIYRRVPGNGSDSSVGGRYRTMSEKEYAGSTLEKLATARYEAMTNPTRVASGMA